jgi:hypothetical protein
VPVAPTTCLPFRVSFSVLLEGEPRVENIGHCITECLNEALLLSGPPLKLR